MPTILFLVKKLSLLTLEWLKDMKIQAIFLTKLQGLSALIGKNWQRRVNVEYKSAATFPDKLLELKMYNSLGLLKPLRIVLMAIAVVAITLGILELNNDLINRYTTSDWINIHVRNYLIVEALYWCAKYRQAVGLKK